ncbi:MAG TPA: hypothetical protein VEH48_02080 [Candidatus Nitrosopolaris sp.]|nr:hypothetical protein [Candidatus Nitrosopolaris sp.]
MQPKKSPYIRDYKASEPQPAALPPDEQVKTEVVSNIPVQQQSASANPISTVPVTPQNNDKDLDKILTDVNREVGKQWAEQDKKRLPLPVPQKKVDKKPAGGSRSHILPIAIAIIIAIALAAAAVSAFKSGGA